VRDNDFAYATSDDIWFAMRVCGAFVGRGSAPRIDDASTGDGAPTDPSRPAEGEAQRR
jgi:hypothetical protein